MEAVGAREPCPCGSGRRYKACHGKEAAKAAVAFVARPFAELAHETSFVAMREILPAATMSVRLKPPHDKEDVLFATILPEQSAAMRSASGRLLIGMQTPTGTGDPSRDLASAILAGKDLAPGEKIHGVPMGGTQRLQDLITHVEPAQLHEAFDFWELSGPEIDEASHALVPTKEIGTDMYWCAFPERRVIRWVIDDNEDLVLDALARMAAAGTLPVDDQGKYLGAFRADGIMIPVWEVHKDSEQLRASVTALRDRYGQARSQSDPLNEAERRARSGLIGRNLTIR